MSRLKKLLAAGLVLAALAGVLSPVLIRASAAEYILEPTALQGRDYTGSDRLAALLDQVFAGDVDIYTDSACTQEFSLPVGCDMNNDTQYYVKSQTTGNKVSGWQCYIYGNAVYNKLFREWVGHANGFAHSRLVIPGGGNSLSYEQLRDAGVRCGAYLRTTGNSDGSYSGSVGHSMLLLAYDENSITYLEGNGDGKGLVRVTIRDWEDFNQRQLSGRGRYIAHMVQPTEEFYKENFPECSHEEWNAGGVCAACGYVYPWEDTLDPWAAGYYRLTETVTPSVDGPYPEAAKAEFTLTAGEKIHVLGQHRNAYDQLWYAFIDADDGVFYVNAASVKLVEYLPLEVSCTDFTPEDGAVLEPKSYPVKGTVTSNYPLKAIIAYLDGEQYAQWTATDEQTVQVDIRKTDINQKLTFSKLPAGLHTITLKAQSFLHGQLLTIHESRFTMVTGEPCTHSYASQVTKEATCLNDGVLTYTCGNCYDTYTRVIAAHGHSYQEGTCIHCGDTVPMTTLTGKVVSSGSAEAPVTVTLRQEGGQTYTATTLEDSYTITGIFSGTYTLEYSKEGCVTGTDTLTLEGDTVTRDIRLRSAGDVTLDGRLNVSDVSKLYAHNRGTNLLQDAYALLCADLTGDGIVNIADVGKLYGKVRG